MTELDQLAVYAFVARLFERFAMSLVIVTISVVSMVAFWRSVQKVEFNLAQDKLGRSANVALATPLFVLLVLVGYAFVSFSHPVAVTVPDRQATDGAADGQTAIDTPGMTLTGFGNLSTSARSSPEAAALRRSQLQGYLRTLNCIAKDASSGGVRDQNAMDAAKVALILQSWQETWGDASDFEDWAMLGTGPVPNEEILSLYVGEHDPC